MDEKDAIAHLRSEMKKHGVVWDKKWKEWCINDSNMHLAHWMTYFALVQTIRKLDQTSDRLYIKQLDAVGGAFEGCLYFETFMGPRYEIFYDDWPMIEHHVRRKHPLHKEVVQVYLDGFSDKLPIANSHDARLAGRVRHK